MDVHLFLCVPGVALWSHTAAELLLLWLAFAAFQMGGLCVLILALQYVEAGVLRSVSFSRRWVLNASRSRRNCSHSFRLRVARRCKLAGTAVRALTVLAEKLSLLTHTYKHRHTQTHTHPPMLSSP